MAQTARLFADYVTALQLVVEEEFIGEALFETLAGHHDGVARQAFFLMAKIERAMIAATEPAIRRNGLQLRDPESLRAEGRAEAETMRDMSWQQFLDHAIADYPAFLEEFDQIARIAPPSDTAEAQILLDHEVAFIEFARAARKGDPESNRILENFLAGIS